MYEIKPYTQTFTLADIYATKLELLQGHLETGQEFIDFRPPVRGEMYMGLNGVVFFENVAADVGMPRLIIDKKKVVKHVYTETGEIRLPRRGEYYSIYYSSSLSPLQAFSDHTSGSGTKILKYERIEE